MPKLRFVVVAACAALGSSFSPPAPPGTGIAPRLCLQPRAPPLRVGREPQRGGGPRRLCALAAADDDEFEWSGLAGAPPTSSLSVLNLAWEASADTCAAGGDLEVLSELLMEMGAMSVVIEDATCDNMHGHWSSIGWGWGEVAGTQGEDTPRDTSSLQKCRVSAYFPQSHDIPATVDALVSALDLAAVPRYTVEPVSDDWSQESQRAMQPVLIQDLLLRFPWHTDEDADAYVRGQGLDPTDVSHRLTLETGVAWGSGEHATTRLCCNWLRNQLPGPETGGRRVMDYGAGSGVLGLCASLFGAKEAVGIELIPAAIAEAHTNAERNGLAFKCYLPSDPAVLEFRDFDVLVANILAGPLVELVDEFVRLLRPAGALALCGIRDYQAETIIEVYSAHFENVSIHSEDQGWVLITASRRK